MRIPNNILISLILLGFFIGCSKQNDEPEQEILRPVRHVTTQYNDGTIDRVFSGTTEAQIESNLSFKVSGTLQSRNVNVGDQLEAGQIIAVLDPTDFNISKHDAEASLANALAELRRAKANYERAKTLYENDNTSKLDLDTARAAAESAAAMVESAGQKLRSAKLQLSYTKLHSPGVCAVADTYMKVNENVNAGTSILKVNCGECANVKIAVPGSFINQITSGSNVSVKMDAFDEQIFAAIVTEVGVSSASTGTAFPVTVALQEGCDQIRAGMAADVTFSTKSEEDRKSIVIPEVASGEDRQGRYVFVLEKSTEDSWIARRRAVVIGDLGSYGLEITSGLDAGEQVVTAGVRRIVDGQRVKLLKPAEK
ncbi:MAG: efflux RND transporter periplasmic adaptor subunit [Gammaproteobacteria bacterium]|nr:efflux RND transporter periplasmic adaptor subunit [Gammaproteobacteria bacterium]